MHSKINVRTLTSKMQILYSRLQILQRRLTVEGIIRKETLPKLISLLALAGKYFPVNLFPLIKLLRTAKVAHRKKVNDKPRNTSVAENLLDEN